MAPKKTPLTPSMARKWSDILHLAFIEALTASEALNPRQFAFHGGTSLHLSWNSPRFSEDLDFLVDRAGGDRMIKLRAKIERRMKQIVNARIPGIEIKIQDKSKAGSNLINWKVVGSSQQVLGNAMVKAEFWQVDPEYLAPYKTEFAYPMKPGDLVSKVSQPLPAATLEAAYADKLTAFATRTALKWRDLFDIWWIGMQIDVDVPAMADRFLHHVTAYTPEDGLRGGMSPQDALMAFMDRSSEDIAAEADPDLKRWLPAHLWSSLAGEGVTGIVDDVRKRLSAIAAEIDARQSPSVTEAEEHDITNTSPSH